MALGAYGEQAVAPACREGKLKLCSRTRAPVCVYDSCDDHHGILKGLNMQQLFFMAVLTYWLHGLRAEQMTPSGDFYSLTFF